MNLTITQRIRARAFACLLGLASAADAHQHFAAGIVDANNNGIADAGEALCFAQGDPEAMVFHLLARPVGQRCGGYYMLDEAARTLFPTDAFSITALSDGQYEIASPRHPATGSWIWAEIVSVSGPAGSTFGFWEENSNTMTKALPANQETGNPLFVISEGFDDPAEDPSGHIHGRAWTASRPGDYVVGIRLLDLSTSGPGGGPIHAPSKVYQFRFSAGITGGRGLHRHPYRRSVFLDQIDIVDTKACTDKTSWDGNCRSAADIQQRAYPATDEIRCQARHIHVSTDASSGDGRIDFNNCTVSAAELRIIVDRDACSDPELIDE